MFFFTYLPQAALMFFTSGPLAAVSAALLVLSESSTLTMVLSKALLIEDSLIDTFDGTLVERGQSGLVAKERQVKGGGAGDVIARLGKLAGKPFAKFTPAAIVRYFMYLPLNFIPVSVPRNATKRYTKQSADNIRSSEPLPSSSFRARESDRNPTTATSSSRA